MTFSTEHTIGRWAASVFAASLFAIAACGPANTQDFASGSITVSDPWARPAGRTGGMGAVYMTIENTGSQDDAVTSITTNAADAAELHTMTMHGGVMRMRALEELQLPPGETVELAPGGNHIMLIGLLAPLKEGAEIEVMLEFSVAEPLTLVVPIRAD